MGLITWEARAHRWKHTIQQRKELLLILKNKSFC